MRWAVLILPLIALSGCQQMPRRAELIKVPAVEGARDREIGPSLAKTLFAPRQYAGFAWDDSGLYGHLHGGGFPGAVFMRISTRKGDRPGHREVVFTQSNLCGPRPGGVLHLPLGLSAEEFRWLRPPGMPASGYAVSFWVSWKALGLGGPPDEVTVVVAALKTSGRRAVFKADLD